MNVRRRVDVYSVFNNFSVSEISAKASCKEAAKEALTAEAGILFSPNLRSQAAQAS